MSEWNHVPDKLPLAVNPLWTWPLRPLAVFRWYADAWIYGVINLVIVGLAFVSLWFFAPSLDTAQSISADWVLFVYARNLALLTLVAGGLHLIFHKLHLQGTEKKYDPRPYPRSGRMFTFQSQIHDNMFWSLASGATVWSAFEVLIWWAMANGLASVTTFEATPVWFVLVFFLIPIWESFYFYWIHRVLHSDALYRFHALHHRNTDVGPWSGLSMHPVEHVMYFGTALIHFVVPTHPVHMIAHLMFYALYAVTTHTGFEGLWARGRKRLHLGNFHHQMHHRYFEVNYGTLEIPWDKLFGTFHDGTAAGKDMMRARLAARRKGRG